MTSPGTTLSCFNSWPVAGSTHLSWSVPSTSISRGASAVPGLVTGAAEGVVDPPPVVSPRQHAGTGDAPGAGVKAGSRQPVTVTGGATLAPAPPSAATG